MGMTRALVAGGIASLFVLVASSAHAQSGGVIIVNGQPTTTAVPAPTTTTTYAAPTYATPTQYPVQQPPPPQPRRSRAGEALLISGITVWGVGYVLELIFGLLGGYHDTTCVSISGTCTSATTTWDPAWDNFRATSLVPIAGPWIQLAVKPPSSHDLWPEWLVIDGVLQGVGAILLFVGVGLMSSEHDDPPPVSVMPMLGPGQAGLMAFGSF